MIEGAHFLASLLGLALVIAARGLGLRLDGAWWTALVVAGLAAVACRCSRRSRLRGGLLAFFVVGAASSRRRLLTARPRCSNRG